jgi:hypothetical protein
MSSEQLTAPELGLNPANPFDCELYDSYVEAETEAHDDVYLAERGMDSEWFRAARYIAPRRLVVRRPRARERGRRRLGVRSTAAASRDGPDEPEPEPEPLDQPGCAGRLGVAVAA